MQIHLRMKLSRVTVGEYFLTRGHCVENENYLLDSYCQYMYSLEKNICKSNSREFYF